jgi:hypothetical protein
VQLSELGLGGHTAYRERVDLVGAALLEGVVVPRSPGHGSFPPGGCLLRSAPRSAGRGGQDQGHSGVGAAQNDRKEKRQRTQQPSWTSALALFIVYFPRRPTRRKRRRSRSRRAYLPPPPPHRPWRLERAWGDQNFSGLRVDLSPVPSVRQLLPFSFRHPSKCQTHHRPLFGFAAPATPSG